MKKPAPKTVAKPRTPPPTYDAHHDYDEGEEAAATADDNNDTLDTDALEQEDEDLCSTWVQTMWSLDSRARCVFMPRVFAHS